VHAMAPKVKPDDIIDCLSDTRVVEASAKALAPYIALSIDDSLKAKLQDFERAIGERKTNTAPLNNKCDLTTQENDALKKIVNDQYRQIDDLESYSRCDNLIIRGLAEQSAAEGATGATSLDDRASVQYSHISVESTVIAFCKDALNVYVLLADISIAHRLKADKKDANRPVIVRFTNRRVRNLVYNSKKQLKTYTVGRVFISEHLTKMSSDLFYNARQLLRDKKIFGTRTQNGQVYVHLSPDPSTRGSLIRFAADLKLRP